MTVGSILNVQRFCTDDGPGIRTTVFLKGCPLKCVWCHNPESQSRKNEIMLDLETCVSCGACAAVCPNGCHYVEGEHRFDREKCGGCGLCAKKCPAGALELFGKSATAHEVFDEVVRDKVFYETSGGGVTVSGGEPLFQPEFTAELLELCRENGIRTAIETCGFAEEGVFRSVAKHCDLILFDVKETDGARHKEYTGVPLEPILRNLAAADEMGVPLIIRAPIIPTLNDREEHMEALKALRASISTCLDLQIMPYHTVGVYKYARLGREYGVTI